MFRVVIVGAGISGLSIAYRLQQLLPAAQVQVLEKAERAGGTMWTLRRDGFQIETGANGFLDTKPATIELCRELGLSDRLVQASPAAAKNRYLFLDGRLRPLPAGLGGLLGTDLLSWRGKLSFLAERWRRKRTEPSDESIAAFARRRAGPEVAAVFADALVTGIWGGDPELLSLPACFPRLAELERRHGSIMKGLAVTARERRREAANRGEAYRRPGTMWSLRDGLRVLIEALRDRLRIPPIIGAAVRKIARDGDASQTAWTVCGEGVERWPADAVVLACPAPRQAEILADLDSELAEHMREIPYNRIALVALGFARADVPMAIDGFGFIAPQRTGRDLLGVQWCSEIYPGRAPGGMVLMRALCGGWRRPEIADWDDARLLQAVRGELRLAMNIQSEPSFHEIIRWRPAIPQYHVGHLDRVAWLEERVRRHPGLFLAGNALKGVAINDCTEQAVRIANLVRSYGPATPGQ